MMIAKPVLVGAGAVAVGCGTPTSGATEASSGSIPLDSTRGESSAGVEPSTGASAGMSAPGSATGGGSSTSAVDGTGPAVIFDVADALDLTEGSVPSCEVVDDMDAVGDCSQTAPPDSFQPDVQCSGWGTAKSATSW